MAAGPEVIGMTTNDARTALSRRAAIAAALAAFAAAPRAQPRVRRGKAQLGFLSGATPDPVTLRTQVDPLHQGLSALGYIDGRNLGIEYRWAEGRYERLPALLDELLRLDPDLLVASGPRPAMVASQGVKNLPIVAVGVDDPVQMGLAASHTRPGGNVTGISAAFSGILQKRLQLLKDVVPSASRYAVLFNPDTAPRDAIAASLPRWEQGLGIRVWLLEVRGPEDFEAAFAAIVRERMEAVSILADAVIWLHRAKLGAFCTQHRLPSIWGGGGYLDAGGLLAYQGDWPALYRRAAAFVDKILKGTPPGEIPFEQGTKLELTVNLKAARTLGITIPHSVLVSADEVIE